MKKLVFATNNRHKLSELKQILGENFQILSLKDLGFREEIPETGDTLKENASQKSHFIYECYGLDCFADDTGLEVDSLGGAPGVYSARYAGENATYDENVEKLLRKLKGDRRRTARFKTVISLLIDGKEYFFEGRVEGVITESRKGKDGFGYDPVFLPDGFDETFAEMSSNKKNQISHRGRAVAQLVSFLNDEKFA